MMMMMKPTFIAHDSINLNAQCAKWGWEWGGGKVMISETEEEETWYKVILRTDGFSETSAEGRQGICFPDCFW